MQLFNPFFTIQKQMYTADTTVTEGLLQEEQNICQKIDPMI